MMPVYIVLYLLAALAFLLAAARVSARVEFVALGLFFWVLVPLIVILQT